MEPNKKLKLSSAETKTHQEFHKYRCVKNTEDGLSQDINDTDTSNVINKTLDNSSGSEYVPSDNEIESGNIVDIDTQIR